MPRSPGWPRIVAESLQRVTGPSPPMLGRRELVTAAEALRRTARLCGVAISRNPPPAYLRPDQHEVWRRSIAAVEQHGGVLVLEAVGRGKTWIALAIAAALRRDTVAIVPAILQSQWRTAAQRAGVPIAITTHERLSRGTLPPGSPDLVMVDEAHRFRTTGARRTQVIAPWLAGRQAVLLTATPIMNRLDDLVTLLRLILPDDVLRLDGIPCLTGLTELAAPPAALRRVAVRTVRPVAPGASRRDRVIEPVAAEGDRAARAAREIRRLRLSRDPRIRRLLTTVLLDAASSSDAAFHAALRRYRALLAQSRDAGGASREAIRRFAGNSFEQLVLWDLVAREPECADLDLGDLPALDRLVNSAGGDEPGLHQILDAASEGGITVCFARHRATATALRQLAGDGTAWVTGDRAGIGPHRLSRPMVLAAFGPDRGQWTVRKRPPSLLIATDVASEGLDLQAADRIVHVDLPWTATRLAQREGRLFRIGQLSELVTVISRSPPRAIERHLDRRQRIQRKEILAATWLGGLEQPVAEREPVVPCIARCRSDEHAELVALAVRDREREGAMVAARVGEAAWTTDPTLIQRLFRQMARGDRLEPCAWEEAAPAAQSALHWAARRVAPGRGTGAALVARLHGLARQASRRRDREAMTGLDRLLRFALASPTLGARVRLERLAQATDAELLAQQVPDVAPGRAPVPAATVLVLFRSGPVPLQCSPCQATRPCSSTSMAP